MFSVNVAQLQAQAQIAKAEALRLGSSAAANMITQLLDIVKDEEALRAQYITSRENLAMILAQRNSRDHVLADIDIELSRLDDSLVTAV